MFLLDTNVVSELRKSPLNQDQKVGAWSKLYPASAFYLSALTIMEIERGTILEELKGSANGPMLRAWITGLRLAYKGRILNFTENTAVKCAQICGKNPPSVDAMIAATAMEHGLTAATRNVSHFNFAGVVVINPWL